MRQMITVFCTLFLLVSLPGLNAQQQTADGGFVICGESMSYTHGDTDFLIYKLDAAGAKEWRKNYGGGFFDDATSCVQTADGGYVICGYTGSYTTGGYGNSDFLVYKLDAAGAKQWRKNLGGEYSEWPYSVIQTSDGGYLVTGQTSSYVHGLVNCDYDFLIYKLDATGAKQWRKNYGGVSTDWGFRAEQTADGGYIVCGFTESYTNGGYDFLAYKLDAAGNKQWRKNYGGINDDRGMFIRQTSDGGYVFSGHSDSYATPGLPGDRRGMANDILVYRLDAAGNKLWRKHYGGTDWESGYDIRQTSDGGFIVCGDTATYSNGEHDFILYKLDAAGAKQWRKNFGGAGWDSASYVVQTADGGYFVLGGSSSYYHGAFENYDLLAYRLDAAGNKMWRKNYGGDQHEDIEAED